MTLVELAARLQELAKDPLIANKKVLLENFDKEDGFTAQEVGDAIYADWGILLIRKDRDELEIN